MPEKFKSSFQVASEVKDALIEEAMKQNQADSSNKVDFDDIGYVSKESARLNAEKEQDEKK